MSITDELRSWADGDALRAGMSMRTACDQALAIADHIDAEYQKAIRELNNLANASVLLPVDADGVPIHVGDEMEGVDKYGSREKVIGRVITVNFEIDGITDVAIRAWNSDGKTWHRAFLDPNASVYRHYHKPTVEDMLWELLGKITPSMEDKEAVPIVKAYAEKLQLADDGKEQ